MTKPKTLEQLRADKERDRDAACTGTAQVGASGEQKEVSGTGRTGRNFDRNGKDRAARRGRDACGTATRMSASLFRRLSAFFGSTPDQAPKAAKFAVLIPGHAGFPKRVKRSEGRDTTPHPKRPPFRPVSRCVRSCWQRRVCTHFHPQKRMWAVLQAIATRAFLPCGTH